MPSLGADMDEGTLLEWLVKPGDTVHRGDIVAVVDTAKSAVEVECFADGVVEALVVDPGQVVPVGAVLARLGENGQPAERAGAASAETAPLPAKPPEQPSVRPPEDRRDLPPERPRELRPDQRLEPALPAMTAAAPSPLVRHRAHELGIDLATLHGSGNPC